jgi:hypothetical protein
VFRAIKLRERGREGTGVGVAVICAVPTIDVASIGFATTEASRAPLADALFNLLEGERSKKQSNRLSTFAAEGISSANKFGDGSISKLCSLQYNVV